MRILLYSLIAILPSVLAIQSWKSLNSEYFMAHLSRCLYLEFGQMVAPSIMNKYEPMNLSDCRFHIKKNYYTDAHDIIFHLRAANVAYRKGIEDADDVFFKAISKTPVHRDIADLGEFLLINYEHYKIFPPHLKQYMNSSEIRKNFIWIGVFAVSPTYATGILQRDENVKELKATILKFFDVKFAGSDSVEMELEDYYARLRPHLMKAFREAVAALTKKLEGTEFGKDLINLDEYLFNQTLIEEPLTTPTDASFNKTSVSSSTSVSTATPLVPRSNSTSTTSIPISADQLSTQAQEETGPESALDEVEEITDEPSPDSETPDESSSIPSHPEIHPKDSHDEDSPPTSAQPTSLTDISTPDSEIHNVSSNSTEPDLPKHPDVPSVTEPSSEITQTDPIADSSSHCTLTMVTVIVIYSLITNF